MSNNTSAPISFENTQVAFAHKSDAELRRSNWLFGLFGSKLLIQLGTKLTPLALKLHLPIKWPIKHTIFKQFCGGETLEEAVPNIKIMGDRGVYTVLDYGVEAKNSEYEYNKTLQETLDAISYAETHGYSRAVVVKVSAFGRSELFERIHAGIRIWKDEEAEFERIKERVSQICATAAKAKVRLLFDAEETWIQQPLDDIIEPMMAKYNKKKGLIFTTIQLYTIHRYAYLEQLIAKAKKEGFIAGAKLVRGAYVEKERKRAKQLNYQNPIQPNKEATDIEYNKALDLSFKEIEHIAFYVASHNEYSCLYAVDKMKEMGLSPEHAHVTFAQLYGMGEHISYNLANSGYRVAKYMPYGPVKDVIPYLLRRAEENSSIDGQVSRELGLITKEIARRRSN